MQQLRNEAQVRRALMPMIREGVEYLMQQVYKENEQLVQELIYAERRPKVYERTGEFARSWSYEPTKGTGISGNTVEYKFKYDPDGMVYTSYLGQHGTPDYNLVTGQSLAEAKASWGDAREYLAEILYQGKTGDLFGDSAPWRHNIDVWQRLMQHCKKRQMMLWLRDGLARQGLEVKMTGWAR